MDVISVAGAQAVLNTVHGYAWGYDKADWGLIDACFDEQATSSGLIDGKSAWGPWSGKNVIIEGLSAIRATQGDIRRHQMATPVFTALTEQDASVQVYLSIFCTTHGEPPRLSTTGMYTAKLKRVANSWKITDLTVELDGPF